MSLEEIQRAVFEVIRQPLTGSQGIRPRLPDGRPIKEIAEELIKPNDRLTSVDRLEIYNRQYWFRVLACIAEDFHGLRAIIGEKQFEKLATAYIHDCPSESYTLRDLPSRLEKWLRDHLEFVSGVERIAVDMVRLEWADVEAFDGRELPRLDMTALATLGEDPVFCLQPHLRLLELGYPVDELLLSIRHRKENEVDIVSNAVVERTRRSKIRRSSLPKPKKVHLAVYRYEGSVYFKRLEPEAFALVRALGQGKALSAAIEDSVNWTNRGAESITAKLQDWFANWSELGWFCLPPIDPNDP
jgi:hypothetical protein